jgi:hypothetical protein
MFLRCFFILLLFSANAAVSREFDASSSPKKDATEISEFHSFQQDISRNLRQRHSKHHHFSIAKIKNQTISGAIIISNLMSESNPDANLLSKTWRDGMEAQNLTATDIVHIRNEHARKFISLMPFPVIEWPAVFTRPCPSNSNGHKSERGLALAHYQIWLDYLYFDPDVLNAVKHNSIHGAYTVTSTSGTFTAYENGTLHKNGHEFHDDDIIVIFEDDADVAVLDANTTILEELHMMNTDLLYLGWCEGKAARPIPLCAHAYAMTRRGVRKAVQHYEPCGPAIDWQFVSMIRHFDLSYRRVHGWSYKNRFNSEYPKKHLFDITIGIIHQKRMASLNGH